MWGRGLVHRSMLEIVLTRCCSLLQAQRRFRERQKTKFIELNTRVEELEGVIGELLSEKTRLEDRTSFLEKALECRSSGSEGNLSAMPCSGSQASSPALASCMPPTELSEYMLMARQAFQPLHAGLLHANARAS